MVGHVNTWPPRSTGLARHPPPGCVGIDKDVLLEDLAANACASTVASLGLLLTTTAKHPTCDWTAWLRFVLFRCAC